jgi:hypothetical protein
MRNRPVTAVDRDRVEVHAVRVIVEELLKTQPNLIAELRGRLARRTDLRPLGDDPPAMMPQDQYVRSRALAILDQAAKP